MSLDGDVQYIKQKKIMIDKKQSANHLILFNIKIKHILAKLYTFHVPVLLVRSSKYTNSSN